MPWYALQQGLRRVSTPVRYATAAYALLLAAFTLARLLRISGPPPLDLANAFAPYLYMPLVISFPLSIIVTRQGPPDLAAAHERLAKKRKRGHDRDETGGRRWNPLLQIALIAISLYWFALPALYRPLPPAAGQTISLVSYNVQGANADLRQATDWLLQEMPDLIALQETAPGIDSRLAPLYAQYAHEDHIAGNARVFSRYPILQREALSLDEGLERWALRLLLDVDGQRLAVYALHLSLPFSPRGDEESPGISPGMLLRYNESRRNRQIESLLAALAEETLPTIVAGDFNMSDASLIYARIAAQLEDAWRGAGSGAGRTFPVAEAIGLPRLILPFLRIDYVWHSAQLNAVKARLGPSIGSDHLPLSVELELPPR